MGGVNKVILLGRLGQDPAITYSQAGMAICRLTLATSEKRKDKEEKTEWHRCIAFDKRAETIGQYLKKGNQIYVEGRLKYGKYVKDNITRYTTDIMIDQFAFVGGKKRNDNNQNENKQGREYQNRQNQESYDDDIPF